EGVPHARSPRRSRHPAHEGVAGPGRHGGCPVSTRVLLVEDDRFLRRAAEAMLRRHGYDVLAAADGEEGLRLALAAPPDVVLLDLVMPRLPGLEVLAALRADARTAH